MQIDWLTVAAQVVNFLILVALLRRFLYRPVLAAMDRREQRIADSLREAEQREADALARREALDAERARLAEERESLVAQARAEADEQRRRWVGEARAEVDRQREHWRVQLEQEWDDQRRALARRLATAATDATRQALSDLADAELEAAMVRVCCRRLASIDEADRAALADGEAPIDVVTTFAPDDEARTSIAEAVRDALGRTVTFTQADDLVAGLELRADGWKMSWTIAAYLSELEAELERAFVTAVRPPET